MEPRLFSRGNHIFVMLQSISYSNLQWSHDYLVVETSARARLRPLIYKPSMEPRLFSRGNELDDELLDLSYINLQWSHDYLVVETLACYQANRSGYSFNGATTI